MGDGAEISNGKDPWLSGPAPKKYQLIVFHPLNVRSALLRPWMGITIFCIGPVRSERGLLRPEMGPFIFYGHPKPAKCFFSLNVGSKMMHYIVALIANSPRIREEGVIWPLSLPLAA